jgi:hypothetical protein
MAKAELVRIDKAYQVSSENGFQRYLKRRAEFVAELPDDVRGALSEAGLLTAAARYTPGPKPGNGLRTR